MFYGYIDSMKLQTSNFFYTSKYHTTYNVLYREIYASMIINGFQTRIISVAKMFKVVQYLLHFV